MKGESGLNGRPGPIGLPGLPGDIGAQGYPGQLGQRGKSEYSKLIYELPFDIWLPVH